MDYSILIRIAAIIFVTVGIVLLFGINSKTIEDTIMSLFIRKRLSDEVQDASQSLNFFQKRFRKTGKKLEQLRDAMEATSHRGAFSYACIASVFCMVGGIAFGGFIDNIVFGIVFGMILCIIPFRILSNMVESYKRSLQDELEMSLNVITMAYIRDENLIKAIDDVIPNLRSPVKEVFEDFSNQVHYVNPSVKKAIRRIREQIDDPIFREWCDNLLLCQEDMDQVTNLLNIIHKYSEQKLVNQKLVTALRQGRYEFFAMVGFLIGNLGLLYIMQNYMDNNWFDLLFTTFFGKVVIIVDAIILFVGIMLKNKFTKPVEYDY